MLRRDLVVVEYLPPKRNRRVERKLPSKRHMHRRTAGPDGPRVRQRLHAPAHLRLHADEPAALGVPRIEPAVGGVLEVDRADERGLVDEERVCQNRGELRHACVRHFGREYGSDVIGSVGADE